MLHDLTKEGGWPQHLPAGAVLGYLEGADVWPGDVIVVCSGEGIGPMRFYYTGRGTFVLAFE